ncbi:MAG: hypothetical protein II781_04935 [Clostridia bacterium]|nr:hypothetical protein [Clostridia bacterium]
MKRKVMWIALLTAAVLALGGIPGAGLYCPVFPVLDPDRDIRGVHG